MMELLQFKFTPCNTANFSLHWYAATNLPLDLHITLNMTLSKQILIISSMFMFFLILRDKHERNLIDHKETYQTYQIS